MHPILLEIGQFKLYSYTVFYCLAFIVGFTTCLYQAQKNQIPTEKILKTIIPILVISLIGGRLYYGLGAHIYADFSLPLFDPFLRGGIAFYGGLIAVCLYLFYFARKENLKLFKLFNCFAPGLAISQAIGRLGCFLNGCCYGKTCSLPWGVNSSDASIAQVLRHPSQIYEFIGLIIVSFLCLKAPQRASSRWQPWRIYLLGYGSLRFFVEFSRGDSIRGIIEFLSLSQWVSLTLIALSLFLDLSQKEDHNGVSDETRNRKFKRSL